MKIFQNVLAVDYFFETPCTWHVQWFRHCARTKSLY